MSLEQEIFTVIFNAIDCGAENGNAEKAWLTIYPHGTDQALSSWLGTKNRQYTNECPKIIETSPLSPTLTSSCKFIRDYALRSR